MKPRVKKVILKFLGDLYDEEKNSKGDVLERINACLEQKLLSGEGNVCTV